MSVSFWSTAPAAQTDASGGGFALGNKFHCNTAGQVTALRYYAQTATSGTVTLRLLNSSSTVLATASETAPGTAGWRTLTLTTPVTLTAGSDYMVTCFMTGTNKTYGALSSQKMSTAYSTSGGELTTVVDGARSICGSTGNNVYAYSATSSTVPTSTFGSSNYGIDVVYSTSTSNAYTADASLAVTATTEASGGPDGPPGDWNLAFSDEFTGTSIDTTKWQADWYAEGGSMNNTPTYAANTTVGGGVATLAVASATSGALIHTDISGGYRLPVGSYVEARIKFAGDGTNLYNWPAFWATSSSADGWPNAGENDIAEVSSSGAGTLGAHYHWPPSNSLDAYQQTGYMGGAFHVYGLHRKASTCDLYWDGVKVATYNTADNGNPEILVLNIGVKSDSNGTQTGPTGAMVVDWVRAWSPPASNDVTLSATATASTTGVVGKIAAAALAATATLTASVTVTHATSASEPVTASITSTATVGHPSAASLAAAASAASTGTVNHPSAASLATTASTTSTGTVGHPSSASLAATASTAATATVTSSAASDASLAATGNITASASVAHVVDALLDVNATLTDGATRSTSADAATNIVAATSTSGLRATSTGATSVAATATTSATATVTSPGQIAATVPVTATLAAAASNSTATGANQTVGVVTITTTATRSATGAASLPVVALLTGTATRGVAGSASLEGTAAITASVNVSRNVDATLQVQAGLSGSVAKSAIDLDAALVASADIVADLTKVTHGDASANPAGYLTVSAPPGSLDTTTTMPDLTVTTTMPDLEVL